MKRPSQWLIVLASLMCLIVGARISIAAQPKQSVSGHELSHVILFEVGQIQLRDGDNITINEVRGTSSTVSAGNTYVIKGTYRLASEKSASLSAYTTGDSRDPVAVKMQSIPDQKTQSTTVKQGSGKFSLILYMWYDGNPHVSFYHDGQSIGGVYFGTGNSVLRPKTSTASASSNESRTAQKRL